MAIGELSNTSGVKIPTIRYYESIGLMPEPERTESNRRVYSHESLRKLRFIRHARELGFDMEAIRQLQELTQHPDQPCDNVHVIAEERLAEIDKKISHLIDLKKKISSMTCGHNHMTVENCRILKSLDET